MKDTPATSGRAPEQAAAGGSDTYRTPAEGSASSPPADPVPPAPASAFDDTASVGNSAYVTIKGVTDGLLIALNTTEEWTIVTGDLGARLDAKSAFFQGARVTVDLGTRPVAKDLLAGLRALFERRGMMLAAVITASETTQRASEALDIRVRPPAVPEPPRESGRTTIREVPAVEAAPPPRATSPDEYAFNSEADGTHGLLVRHTLRSGRSVHSNGHVVVLGDVNAGAQITAAGDVIIWGRLRGIVHAGAQGDETAVVCALDMSPTQLRIAGLIAIAPPDKRSKPKPETAVVRDRQIIVEAWKDKPDR